MQHAGRGGSGRRPSAACRPATTSASARPSSALGGVRRRGRRLVLGQLLAVGHVPQADRAVLAGRGELRRRRGGRPPPGRRPRGPSAPAPLPSSTGPRRGWRLSVPAEASRPPVGEKATARTPPLCLQQRGDRLAGLRVPQADASCRSRRRRASLPSGEKATQKTQFVVALQRPLQLARRHVPQDDVAVEAGRRQRLAVGREGDAADHVLVPFEQVHAVGRSSASSSLTSLLLAAHRQRLAVGRARPCRGSGSWSRRGSASRGASSVISSRVAASQHLDRLVPRAGDERLAVLRQRQGVDALGVAGLERLVERVPATSQTRTVRSWLAEDSFLPSAEKTTGVDDAAGGRSGRADACRCRRPTA